MTNSSLRAGAGARPQPDRSTMSQPLRQPRGLLVLVATEAWERFSFYGMQALLIFYLTKHFLLSDARSLAIFGSYVALAQAAPLLGGFVADRWLGLRKAVVLGAVLLMFGHFGMAFEGHAAVERMGPSGASLIVRDDTALQVMYLSLALIALGTGFLKPNITAALSSLYSDGDPRRDAGFTYFFLGINVGGGLAALLVGGLGQTVGWSYGFGAAGIGMLIGLITFLMGQHHLGERTDPPSWPVLRQSVAGIAREWLIYLGVGTVVVIAWRLIQHRAATEVAAIGAGLAVGAWLVAFLARRCTSSERRLLMVALVLTAFNIVFWVAVFQAASSISLFIDREVDRHILGFEVQASQFLVLSTVFVLLFAPVVGQVSVRLGAQGREPGVTLKFAVGMIINSLGFVTLAGAAWWSASGTVHPAWIVLAYAFNSAGELLVAPTGLAMITKLSPSRVVGTMTGVWFLMIAGAGLIASSIAGATVPTPSGASSDLLAYRRLFIGIAAALALTGFLLLILRRPLERRAGSSI